MDEKVTAIIEEFIRKFQNERQVEIIKHEYDDKVVDLGRNFASVVSRLRITYVDKTAQKSTKSFIIKIPFLSPRYEQLRRTNIYSTELFVFDDLFPKLYAMNPQAQDENHFTAFCYHTIDETLFLEDLGETGFISRTKIDLLDFEHCQIAMKTLARFHATSYKYLKTVEDKNLALMDYIIKLDAVFWELIDKRCDLAIELISTFAQTKPTTIEKLKKYKNDRFTDNQRKTFEPDRNGRNVIIHGDFNASNILFKYNEEKRVCNSKMIDWQFCRICSPMQDLLTLFVSSVQFEVFEKFKNELLDSYLKEFNRILDESKCAQIHRYTAEELSKDFEASKFYFVNLIIYILPIYWNLFMDSADEEGNDNSTYRQMYETVAQKWLGYIESQEILS